jgi:hypothetical protein
MASTEWETSGTTLRMTTTGTLVGMPALSPEGSYGYDAIVPCDDPDDETSLELPSPWRFVRPPARFPTPLPLLPTRSVMPVEERRLLARAALVASMVVAGVAALLGFWP